MARFGLLLLILALTLLGPSEPAAALGAQVVPAVSDHEWAAALDWSRGLDAVERYIKDPGRDRHASGRQRARLKAVSKAAQDARAEAHGNLAQARRLLEALGPAAAANEPPDTPELSSHRARLADAVAGYRAQVAEADLTLARAQSLDEALSALGRETLVENLLEPLPVPVAPDVLLAVVPEMFEVLNRILRSPYDWYAGLDASERQRLPVWPFVAVGVLMVIVAIGLRLTMSARLGRRPEIAEPTYARRLVAAVAEAFGRGLVPAALIGACLIVLARPDPAFTGLFMHVVRGALLAAGAFVLAASFTQAVLAPRLPAWRLTELPPDKARAIAGLINLLAAIVAADIFLFSTLKGLDVSAEFTTVYLSISTVLEALGLLALSAGRLWNGETAAADTLARFWRGLRRLIALLAVIAIAATLIGYGHLGSFLVKRLLFSGAILGFLLLIRGLLAEVIEFLGQSDVLRRRLAVEPTTQRNLRFWLRAAIDPLVLILAILAVVPLWGVAQDDLLRWTTQALTGFTVGSVTISITDIALAMVVFLLAMAGTRLIQRALVERVLAETSLDPSVRHSLSAGVGYVGVVVAAAISVAVLGINLTNVALLAGALSVGIGFGLQDVVKNFVAGLILLVERPVKVGDWVVVGGKEGLVKRISFRATELETFQRASVIIPNAEILSTAVTNWTHKDRYGRVEVAVGVAYDTDTARVRDLLLEIAHAHPLVMREPPPKVLFVNFADSSLDFELRCYTNNVVERGTIASDLRYAIGRRFAEDGIEIPFPQRVVHLVSPPPAPSAD